MMKTKNLVKNWEFVFLVVFCLLLGLPFQTHGALISTFNSNTEGWSTTDSTVDLQWVSGGYVEELDTSPYGAVWYFVSPGSWDGNWSSYIGGTLQYDMRFWKVSSTGSRYGIGTLDTIRIYSGAANYAAWISSYNPTSTGPYWDTLEFQLSETSSSSITGTKSFNEIMSDVTALNIRGDWWTMADRTGLDNVSVDVVPIPSALWLLGSGLVGIAGIRRKIKN